MTFENLTTGQKELKLKRVCGGTTTLESSWKTIQSPGGSQTETKIWANPTTASISIQNCQRQEHGLSGNALIGLEVVLVPMTPLPASI